MKIRLLNCGGFAELGAVSFPAEVEAACFLEGGAGWGLYGVTHSELRRIGADLDCFNRDTPLRWWLPNEVEVLP